MFGDDFISEEYIATKQEQENNEKKFEEIKKENYNQIFGQENLKEETVAENTAQTELARKFDLYRDDFTEKLNTEDKELQNYQDISVKPENFFTNRELYASKLDKKKQQLLKSRIKVFVVLYAISFALVLATIVYNAFVIHSL